MARSTNIPVAPRVNYEKLKNLAYDVVSERIDDPSGYKMKDLINKLASKGEAGETGKLTREEALELLQSDEGKAFLRSLKRDDSVLYELADAGVKVSQPAMDYISTYDFRGGDDRDWHHRRGGDNDNDGGGRRDRFNDDE